ncbi:MAG: response regulator [Proteobacteria bacterium]|nr:response regulator [Pseudomonadota bacterium]
MPASKTCLLVEDSRVIRKVAATIMEGLGYTCREAENGELAMQECKKAMPDFVLLDWNMQVMNGIDFLKQLRGLPNGKTPKVIFCTTQNEIAHIQEGLAAGADEYIMKPFDSDIIRSKLEMLGLIEESG